MASLYRSVSSHHNLLPETLTASNDRSSAQEIAAAARPLLDAHNAGQLTEFRGLYELRAGDGRTTMDMADAARAATFGAIEALLVDMDSVHAGTIDEETGAVTFAEAEGPQSYDIVDEIMSRALASGAKVMAARSEDIPGNGSLAAILRYAA